MEREKDLHETENLENLMLKWPNNMNKRPELEKCAVSALPPSAVLHNIAGTNCPVYTLNVRVIGIQPSMTDLTQVVRGHCAHYTCNAIVTNIDWANSGPLNYGKLARPYCPECCQARRKRYLNLFFHLTLRVEDSLGQVSEIVVERDEAVRFFGCTVYRFLLNIRKRLRVKRNLESLIQASSAPRSAAIPGVTFDAHIIPVVMGHTENVELRMFGDNIPLFELAKKTPVARL